MKTSTTPLLMAAGVLVASVSPVASAQTIPPNPLVPAAGGNRGQRNLGGGSAGLDAGLSGKTRQPGTITIEYHAVSPLRAWTNLEGKKITARLLAYSVPKPGTTGAAEILREGKVLFLIPGKSKPIQYPKDQLDDDDQIEIERIVEAASFTKMPPKESEEKGATVKEEK